MAEELKNKLTKIQKDLNKEIRDSLIFRDLNAISKGKNININEFDKKCQQIADFIKKKFRFNIYFENKSFLGVFIFYDSKNEEYIIEYPENNIQRFKKEKIYLLGKIAIFIDFIENQGILLQNYYGIFDDLGENKEDIIKLFFNIIKLKN